MSPCDKDIEAQGGSALGLFCVYWMVTVTVILGPVGAPGIVPTNGRLAAVSAPSGELASTMKLCGPELTEGMVPWHDTTPGTAMVQSTPVMATGVAVPSASL